jgi:hypothetical protein
MLRYKVANRGPGAANPTNGPLAAWVELATDLATELSGTGWLSEGSAGTTRPETPNRSGLGCTARAETALP